MERASLKVNGIRAILGARSGTASLEKFSYEGASSAAGSGLRLHLTIDQSFKDRLAQSKKMTASGQWSPISPTPACPATVSIVAPNRGWDAADCPGNLFTDLGSVSEDIRGEDHGYAQQASMDMIHWDPRSVVDSVPAMSTPADLSDLSTVDLLPFPAYWNVELADLDVDADFFPLTDNIRPSLADLGSLFQQTGTDCFANDQSCYSGFQLSAVSNSQFPVYDDVFEACAVSDDVAVFDGIEDVWWNTFNTAGHAISVQ